MMRSATTAIAVALLAAAPVAAQKKGADPLAGFDAYVAQAVKAWEVPGLAIAVVKDDSVVFAKGYGVRTLGATAPVDAHTLFANGSTTKAFTSLSLMMLVDSGRLRLDDRVEDRWPSFQLYDPYVTRELTIRDLLTHRSGLPEADFLWYGNDADFAEIVRRMRWVKPATSLRSHFAYENDTYATAGYIAARAADTTWEALVRGRIFDPLGMRETTTGTPPESQPDLATPHFRIDDTVRVITRYATDNIAPAGSMYSSVADMAKWIRFLLDSARVGQKRLLSDSNFAELFRPQMIVGADEFYPTARLTHPHFTGYGLGWFLEDYRGEYVVFHTGSIDGFVAIVGLIPDRKLGVVIFANLDHAEVRHALMYRVFDAYIGNPRRDWSAEMLTLYRGIQARARAAEHALDSARVPNTKPSLPLESYAGTYTDTLYGTVKVRMDGGHLVLEQGYLLADLSHWNFDTFQARFRNRWVGETLVSFLLGQDGKVAEISFGDDYRLRRVGVP